MQKRWMTSAVVAVVSASAIGLVSPAQAVASPTMSEPAAEVRAERLLVGVDPGSRTFDGAEAVRAGAPVADVEEFAAGYAASGGTTRNVEISEADVASLRTPAAGLRSCSGRNSSDVTGIQVNLYLNSCNTTRLAAALGAGAGFAGIVGLITGATGVGALAGGIAAGLLAVGSGAVAYCGARGRGIGFHVLPVGPPWCRSQ